MTNGTCIADDQRLTANGLEFNHAGFGCIVREGAKGRLCGYVLIPPGHPWYEREPEDLCGLGVNHCKDVGALWRIGFDVAAAADDVPAGQGFTVDDVADVCRKLADTAARWR